jgi:hypothetical protein
MDDRTGSTDAAVVSQAYVAARDLLRQAEEDAARIRADADRYRRQREQEAELIVGKARRLLEMAEQRAVAPQPLLVDLDAPPAAAPQVEERVGAPTGRVESALDAILATAVSNAIHRALPSDR